jgi:tripartite-type tricarboxylate transporter receptor subunit TctC
MKAWQAAKKRLRGAGQPQICSLALQDACASMPASCHKGRMDMPRILLAGLIALGAAVHAAAPALAQAYPSKVIKMIVPAGPGGPTDLLARLVGERMSSGLGQPVVLDNRGGGGGAIAARAVALAEPDGYTLLFGNTATLANIPAVSKSAGYDPTKSFAAVAKVMDSYMLLVVRPDAPWTSVAELVAYAKANPGRLNHGAAGAGNLTHLGGELLKVRANVDFVAVQYKSSAEFNTALLGGQIDFAFDNVTSLRALIDDGKLRALAVTSAARQPDFPAVPTMMEAGVPDYVMTAFFGVVAPAGTPAPIVAKLNAVINDGLKTETLQSALRKLGAAPAIESPEKFGAFISAEMRKWTEISAVAGIKVD